MNRPSAPEADSQSPFIGATLLVLQLLPLVLASSLFLVIIPRSTQSPELNVVGSFGEGGQLIACAVRECIEKSCSEDCEGGRGGDRE